MLGIQNKLSLNMDIPPDDNLPFDITEHGLSQSMRTDQTERGILDKLVRTNSWRKNLAPWPRQKQT